MRVIETHRLHLRRFTPDDAGHLFDLDGDPEVMRFLTGGTPTPRDIIETEFLPRFLHYHERFPSFGFWAGVAKATGDFIGWFSLRPLDEEDSGEASLGFRLRRDAWGQGYATEGARALIRLAFTSLGVQRIVATTYQDNVASRRVMQKIGMALTRTFRFTSSDLNQADTFHVTSQEMWDGDDIEYSLQRADWERQERE